MKVAYREGNNIVLNTDNGQYRFLRSELLAAEMQDSLGYVIASHFVGQDRLIGKMTINIYKDAVREVLIES